jgi:hypothetical protein
MMMVHGVMTMTVIPNHEHRVPVLTAGAAISSSKADAATAGAGLAGLGSSGLGAF